ncbi:MAG: ABC transporter permease [Candidatus Methylomirabilis sp.]|nr:ABC transporter permease [Deltaproteobacteria bacterium]
MERIRIFNTLLWKETRKLRYNPALQFILALFIVLAAIISLSRGGTADAILTVYLQDGAGGPFAQYLKDYEPKMDVRTQPPPARRLEPTELTLAVPEDLRGGGELRIVYPNGSAAIGQRARALVVEHLHAYLETPLPLSVVVADERGKTLPPARRAPVPERKLTDAQATKELTMVMICTLSLLVISFNLFSMMFAEEKSSKTLLAQMISPATAGDVVRAKFVFFMTLNLGVAAMVAAIHAPAALRNPLYWTTMALGSVTYMSLALLIVAYTQKQSSASLLSLGYLFFLGIVVLLSGQLSVFATIQRNLPETYLFKFIATIFAGKPLRFYSIDYLRFVGVVTALVSFAFLLFDRKGLRAA